MACSTKLAINSKIKNPSNEIVSSLGDVYILKINDSLPDNVKEVGELKIGEGGLTVDCGIDKVFKEAKIIAQKSGANIVKLTSFKKPDAMSTCYRIKAKMYSLPSDSKYVIDRKIKFIENNKSRLPENADYAMVYIYRTNERGAGSGLGYAVRNQKDSVVCKVYSSAKGTKCPIKITEFGKHTFYAQTESKTEVTLDIEKGKEYFYKATVGMGFAVGRPLLSVIDENSNAINEYDSIQIIR